MQDSWAADKRGYDLNHVPGPPFSETTRGPTFLDGHVLQMQGEL